MRKLSLLLAVLLLLSQTAFAVETENSVRIAIIDTGISTQALDSGQIAQGKNYILPKEDTEDKINHGTAIASLIIGKPDRELLGVYSEARLVPLVYYSLEGKSVVKGDAAMLAQIIYDAVDVFSCRVINLSAGVLIDSNELKDACEYAEKKGVVIVSAVGNDNQSAPQNIYYPAAYDTVIGVGSINENREISRFSQRNSSVSLVTGGEDLWVARASGRMTHVSGTSYASAFVSSAAARIMSENQELTPAEVRRILYESATDMGEAGYDQESGYGVLNTQKALELVQDHDRFSDVPKTSWYFDAVNRIYSLGLISGTSKTEFSPDLTTTKAMVLTILYRMADEPTQFESAEDWYSSPRAWAKKHGISDGENMEAPIPREEVADILWRFASYKGADTRIHENKVIDYYRDFSSISEYAVPALQWAVGAGIIRGNTKETLNPKGNASRAEFVTIISNYFDNIEQQ